MRPVRLNAEDLKLLRELFEGDQEMTFLVERAHAGTLSGEDRSLLCEALLDRLIGSEFTSDWMPTILGTRIEGIIDALNPHA